MHYIVSITEWFWVDFSLNQHHMYSKMLHRQSYIFSCLKTCLNWENQLLQVFIDIRIKVRKKISSVLLISYDVHHFKKQKLFLFFQWMTIRMTVTANILWRIKFTINWKSLWPDKFDEKYIQNYYFMLAFFPYRFKIFFSFNYFHDDNEIKIIVEIIIFKNIKSSYDFYCN